VGSVESTRPVDVGRAGLGRRASDQAIVRAVRKGAVALIGAVSGARGVVTGAAAAYVVSRMGGR
jgi:succinylarginine dihydrolase